MKAAILNQPKQDIPMLISMCKNHMIELDQLVSKEIDLEEINQTFKSFETGNSLRNVISFN
jgi:Zn-dependent alcohol dehydrogenase